MATVDSYDSSFSKLDSDLKYVLEVFTVFCVIEMIMLLQVYANKPSSRP